MNTEKNIVKTKKSISEKLLIIFLCALLIVSWGYIFISIQQPEDVEKSLTVNENTAKKIEQVSSDFMSFMCDLDFKNAIGCLEHRDMADNLTSELTHKAINSFSDSFLYETANFEELRNSDDYANIKQKALDFIKENSSYEITDIKKEDDIYYVSLLLNCIESSDLLNMFADNTNYSNSAVSSSQPSDTEEDAEAEISSSSEIFDEINKKLDSLLINTEKKKINVTLKLLATDDTFKISDLTDMNFVKFFIQ